MLSAKLQLALRQFENIEALISSSQRARDIVLPYGYDEFSSGSSAVDAAYAKVYDYCAAITRAYSTFERFVLDAVEQWVEWCFQFDSQIIINNPTALHAYELGVAEILRRSREPRFADIDRSLISKSLSMFYGGNFEERWKFSAEPFFALLPNINLELISKLFREVGLDSADGWLANHAGLKYFAAEEGFNIKEAVKDLVERRNEAAHGNGPPEDIFGARELNSRLKLLRLVCQSIADLVIFSACQKARAQSVGYAGAVTKVWAARAAFELNATDKRISVGDHVLFVKSGEVQFDVIASVQFENRGCRIFYGPGALVGIALESGKMPTRNASMILPDQIIGLEKLVQL